MTKNLPLRPRRSLLFVPGSHERAVQKAFTLSADVILFDLEDGVADSVKEEARQRISEKIKHAQGEALSCEVLVRVNASGTTWEADDLTMLKGVGCNGVVLPKVESAEQIEAIASHLKIPVWANVETPLGVLHASEIAAHPSCAALIAGTNDLRAGLGLTHQNDRTPLLHSLAQLVLAAKAYRKLVFDGTYIQLDDQHGLEQECSQGKAMGFDGKTLVHPKQIAIANEVFAPSDEEIAQAKKIIAQYEKTLAADQSVDLVDGQMIEALHVKRAQDLLAMHKMIREE